MSSCNNQLSFSFYEYCYVTVSWYHFHFVVILPSMETSVKYVKKDNWLVLLSEEIILGKCMVNKKVSNTSNTEHITTTNDYNFINKPGKEHC